MISIQFWMILFPGFDHVIQVPCMHENLRIPDETDRKNINFTAMSMVSMVCWVHLTVCTPFGKFVQKMGWFIPGEDNSSLIVLVILTDYHMFLAWFLCICWYLVWQNYCRFISISRVFVEWIILVVRGGCQNISPFDWQW